MTGGRSVRSRLGSVFATRLVPGRMCAVRLVDLAGAVLAIKIMTFAGNGKNTGSHQQHREKFHRTA